MNSVASTRAIATSVVVTHLLNIHADESLWKRQGPRTHARLDKDSFPPGASSFPRYAPKLKHWRLFFQKRSCKNCKSYNNPETQPVMGLPAWKLWPQIYTISTFRFPQVRKSSQMNEQLLGSALWWGLSTEAVRPCIAEHSQWAHEPLVGTLKDAFATPAVVRQEMASTIIINRI